VVYSHLNWFFKILFYNDFIVLVWILRTCGHTWCDCLPPSISYAAPQSIFGLLTGVAWIGTVVATVNSTIRPSLSRCGYGSMTCGIGANLDLVLQSRHELTSICRVMDFMITIGLGVLVDDKSWHWLPPWLRVFSF
jgi:hypothetical protein